MHDREEREQDNSSPPQVPAPRQRCYSFCAQGPPFYVDSSDDESDTDDDQAREFTEAYRSAKLERIESMSRDEVIFTRFGVESLGVQDESDKPNDFHLSGESRGSRI